MMEEAFSGEGRVLNKKAIAFAAHMLGDSWALLIVSVLLRGRLRFRDILQQVERINPQTLSGRLKMLEQYGFLVRHAYAEVPVRVEYELTEKGYAVSAILEALSDFGERYMPEGELP